MARLLTPELEAAIDTGAPPPEETGPPLDQLAGEIAALEVWAAEAQAKGELPAQLPEIEAADRCLAEAEGTARAIECIGDVLTRKTR